MSWARFWRWLDDVTARATGDPRPGDLDRQWAAIAADRAAEPRRSELEAHRRRLGCDVWCSGCDGLDALARMQGAPVAVGMCDCGEVLYRDGGAS